MPFPRNGPCPCGSGRRYKRCCGSGETGSSHLTLIPGRQPTAGGRSELRGIWEADLVPMPATLEDDPAARLAVALVMGEATVLHHRLLSHAPSELPAIAEAIIEAFQEAVAAAGEPPAELRVRDPVVARLLGPRLAFPRVTVRNAALSWIDDASRSLAEHFGGSVTHRGSSPETWEGWELPEPVVAELFRAAADYYRAAPWHTLNNRQTVEVTIPPGRRWTACIMGNGGTLYGLALYQEPEDYLRQLTAQPGAGSLPPILTPILSLTFSSAKELDKTMLWEILSAGWDVADPHAFPRVSTYATPGGGFSRQSAQDLTAALRLIPRFVAAHRKRLAQVLPGRPVRWRDGGSGIALAYYGVGLVGEPNPVSPLPDGLSPADLQEMLQGDWLTGGGLRLNPGLSLAEVSGSIYFRNARILLATVRDDGPAPATATGNLARTFVATMLDRLDWESGYVEQVRAANRTINELDVFPLHIMRLVLVEAGLLRRRRGFHLSSDARLLLADGRAGELYLRLFLAFFRRLNLAYLDAGGAHPGVQETIAWAFRRLQSQATKWIAPQELAGRLWLDGALDPPNGYERLEPDRWVLRLTEARLFYPLFDFGLLERRLLRRESAGRRHYRIRKTPLYDRFIRFGAAP